MPIKILTFSGSYNFIKTKQDKTTELKLELKFYS